MGEMSSMGGSIYNMVKGPPDPGVQPTSAPPAGPYSPTAEKQGAGMLASLGGGGATMSDIPPPMPAPSARPGSIQPIGTDFGITPLAGGYRPSPATSTGAVSAPAGIFGNVAPKGGVSTEGAAPQDRFNVPAMVSLANSIAQTGRGFVNDFSKGPGASPLAPRSGPGGMPYQPTARNRPLTLRDLLARR